MSLETRVKNLVVENLGVDADAASECLEGRAEAHLVVLGDEADDVAARAAAEAVEEPLRRRDVEAGRLLLVKGARCHELPAFLLELDASLSDDLREVARGFDPLDPLLGDLHLSPPP